MIVIVCLLASAGVHALASPTQSSDEVQKIRVQVEQFKRKDFLQVKLHNNSEMKGCFKRLEVDAFVIGPPGGHPGSAAEQLIPYADVLTVKKEKRSFLKRLLDGTLIAAYIGAVGCGLAKVGANTPKTKAVKAYVGLALLYPLVYGLAVRGCR